MGKRGSPALEGCPCEATNRADDEASVASVAVPEPRGWRRVVDRL